MSRDREDFRADWGDGSEPECELDDREQADAPEIEDPEGLRLNRAMQLDELYGERDSIISQIQSLEDKLECLNDEIGHLEDELEE